VPSFWGARVPNNVLPQAAYERLKASGGSSAQRAKHFNSRADWYRLLSPSSGYGRAQAMIVQWPNLGIIEPSNPPQGHEGAFHVEVSPYDAPEDDPTIALITAVEELSGETIAPIDGASAARGPSLTNKRVKPARIHSAIPNALSSVF
jgi:hypothetical protein